MSPKSIVVVADDDTRLARLHLRVGMLTLARAELEDLERRDALDDAGRAALAEARWRTGDLEEAAVAARAHLDAGGDDPVSICIAAEAAAAEGRPGEARGFMDRLGPPDAPALDALFSGMPRRAFWPSASGEPISAETLFGEVGSGHDRAGSAGSHASAPSSARATGPARAAADRRQGRQEPARSIPGPREVIEATESGFWTDAAVDAAEPAATGAAPGAAARPRRTLVADPVTDLAAALDEMASDPERALLRLAIVLRIDPTLAPAVLDAVGGRREAAAALLRGDAQRLLGRHLEAEAAFAGAAEALDRPETPKP